MKNIWIILFMGLFLASCSVQKRHYMKGLYFENHSSKKQEKTESATIESFYKKGKDASTKANKESETITASLKADTKNEVAEIKEPSPVNPVVLFENCDTLFLRDGTVIAAKITEIGVTEIKYHYCSGGETEVVRVVLKSAVDRAVFSNGMKETFEKPAPVTYVNPPEVFINKRTNGPAVAGFLMSLVIIALTFLYLLSGGYIEFMIAAALFFFPALVFSILGISQTSKYSHKGKGLAIAGLIICLVSVFFIILALFL